MAQMSADDGMALVALLNSMDIEACAGVLVTVLQARPQLASVLVSVAVPAMTYAPSAILTTGRMTGTIKSFNQAQGFGFIACPELFELFQRDVFVHGKQMRDLAVGTQVTFAIVLNKDNHPQGFDITDVQDEFVKGKGGPAGKGASPMLSGKGFDKGFDKGFGKGESSGGMEGKGDSWGGGKGGAMGALAAMMAEAAGLGGASSGWGGQGDSWGGKGDMWGGKGDSWGGGMNAGMSSMGWGKGGDVSSAQGKGCMKGPPGKADVKEELGQGMGTIKSFSEKNGYGFIDCLEMKEMGYKDVFVHYAQLNGFNVGDTVVFTCFLNSKGNAQAKDLMSEGQARVRQVMDNVTGGAPAAAAAAPSFGGGDGGMFAGKAGGKRTFADRGPDVREELGQLVGTIKSFNEKNGYGFIACPDAAMFTTQDIFLHHAQKGDFQIGDCVMFMAFINKSGKVQAKDLEAADPAAKRARLM